MDESVNFSRDSIQARDVTFVKFSEICRLRDRLVELNVQAVTEEFIQSIVFIESR